MAYDDGLYETIVMDIVKILDSRKGFDNWWYNIDDEIMTEIIEEMIESVKENILKG